MTPAVNLVKRSRITYQLHSYAHEPGVAAYGQEAADKLGLDPHQVFKTLLVQQSSGQLAVAVIPVCCSLDLKAVGQALGSKKVAMADPQEAQRVTGYLVGGISPLAQKRALPTLIDESAYQFATIFVSGGRRGLDLELAPADLQRLTRARRAAIAR